MRFTRKGSIAFRGRATSYCIPRQSHEMRRARCGDTERGERGAEPRNEEKQDGSITRYEALPRNVMEQVRLCIMNKIHMEEKPSIPRQSHGTRRTMCENTEREEQGAETRNEKSKVRRHGTRRARCRASK